MRFKQNKTCNIFSFTFYTIYHTGKQTNQFQITSTTPGNLLNGALSSLHIVCRCCNARILELNNRHV